MSLFFRLQSRLFLANQMREQSRAKEANKKQNRYVCFGYGCCCRAQSFFMRAVWEIWQYSTLFFHVTESLCRKSRRSTSICLAFFQPRRNARSSNGEPIYKCSSMKLPVLKSVILTGRKNKKGLAAWITLDWRGVCLFHIVLMVLSVKV